jgi:hypothetical protein
MTYAVDGLRGVMIKGTSLVNVLPDVVIVGTFALLMVLLGNVALYMSLSGKSLRIRHRDGNKKNVKGEEVQPQKTEEQGTHISSLQAIRGETESNPAVSDL